MNGVILGMPRAELEKRLPQIIEFAGMEEFIDTPVKHYSSGMTARLGFAVAVHLEPDVLLVDEVLAVGDAEFQEKCFRKIEEFKREGVTIFFVSHDMDAMRRVCDRVLWIEDHVVKRDGPALGVIAAIRSCQMIQLSAFCSLFLRVIIIAVIALLVLGWEYLELRDVKIFAVAQPL